MSEERGSLEARIKRVLDQEIEQLDAITRSRLARARARALAPVTAPAPLRQWAPIGGVVLASALAIVLWWGEGGETPQRPALAPGDFELLTATDSLQLFEELDFFLWLEEEADRAG